MKLSNNAVVILNSATKLQQGIVFKEGSTIETCNVPKTVALFAKVKDVFPVDCGIYDLRKFLKIYKLMEEPELEFGDGRIFMKNEDKDVSFTTNPPSLIISPPRQEEIEKIMSYDVSASFKLSKIMLDEINEMSSVLKVDNLKFVYDGEDFYAKLFDNDSSTSDVYKVAIPDVDVKGVSGFEAVVNLEYLKLLSLDYNVVISDKKIMKLSTPIVTYYANLGKDSKFTAQ